MKSLENVQEYKSQMKSLENVQEYKSQMKSLEEVINETEDASQKRKLKGLKYRIVSGKQYNEMSFAFMDQSFLQILSNEFYPSLKTLIIFQSNIVDISPLSNLPSSLQDLELSQNKIVDISPLSNLPSSLQILDLSENRIMDISPLNNLPFSLKKLYLYHNKIVDISPLSNLPFSLEVLDLRFNQSLENFDPVTDQIAYKPNLYILCRYQNNVDELMANPQRKLNAQLLSFQSRQITRLSRSSGVGKLRQNERDFPVGRMLIELLKKE